MAADLDNILVFVKVAQFESISRAGRSLGIPVSTVSRRLSVLESSLGVSLLRRTTRRVTLTPQGKEYFQQCQEPVALLQEAERVLTNAQAAPEGLLRISIPITLGQQPFLDFLSRFLKDYPQIRIDLFVTNLFLDLVAENIDIAIRVGNLKDSSLVATRIGTHIRYLVAAPQYLKGRKPPTDPAELAAHDCVMLNAKNNQTVWNLVSGRKTAQVHVSGQISARDDHSVGIFVHAGHGIGFLTATHSSEALADGRLVRILARWSSPQIPIFAVYSSRKFLPSRLSVFLEALVQWKNPHWIRE
jgi:DNA-binding transcriptional LysR family regulator